MKSTKTNRRSFRSRLSGFLEKSSQEKNRFFIIAISFPIIFALILLTIKASPLLVGININDYKAGEIAEKDIIPEHDIVYIDEEATELKLQAMRQLVSPVFRMDTEIKNQTLSAFEDFAYQFIEVLKKESSVKNIFLRLQVTFPGLFTESEIKTLLDSPNIEENISTAYTLVEQIMEDGVVTFPEDTQITKDTIEIWNPELNKRKEIAKSEAVTITQLDTAVKARVERNELTSKDITTIVLLVTKFARVNTFYDQERTEQLRADVVERAEPVVKRIQQGKPIIKKNSIISVEDMQQLETLKQESTTTNVYTVLSIFFYLLILYALAITIFRPPFVKTIPGTDTIVLILGMVCFFLLVAFIIKQFVSTPDWLPFSVLLPSSLTAMLVAILINSRTAILYTLIISLLVFMFQEKEIVSFLFSFFSGIGGTLVIIGSQKRIDLIKATFLLTVISGVLMAVFLLLSENGLKNLPYVVLYGGLNGFICGFINLSILPLLEHLLNAPTNFRLMELSDTNTPMLKRMLMFAPGTYSHSLNVANLAESACREIGANALLARVGAFYHDIGKIDQADYFIENQRADNKHNDLKPSLSVAVIKSHLKIGIEKAKELKLPKAVIDVIAQHHGSGLISYFYSEALKETKNTKVQPEDYSYSGYPPKSKEAAVVMLADTIDAATRTLKKPTLAKLEKVVWDIIMQRFKEKQLNDCDLTFKDLETIKRTFVQILAGYFHSRIEYPRTVGETS